MAKSAESGTSSMPGMAMAMGLVLIIPFVPPKGATVLWALCPPPPNTMPKQYAFAKFSAKSPILPVWPTL